MSSGWRWAVSRVGNDRTNDDIAFLLGYEDTTSFLCAFCAWTGQTVSDYRRNNKE